MSPEDSHPPVPQHACACARQAAPVGRRGAAAGGMEAALPDPSHQALHAATAGQGPAGFLRHVPRAGGAAGRRAQGGLLSPCGARSGIRRLRQLSHSPGLETPDAAPADPRVAATDHRVTGPATAGHSGGQPVEPPVPVSGRSVVQAAGEVVRAPVHRCCCRALRGLVAQHCPGAGVRPGPVQEVPPQPDGQPLQLGGAARWFRYGPARASYLRCQSAWSCMRSGGKGGESE